MIIAEVKGNILLSDAQTLVCPVNTVGSMGKGLALSFKKAYPDLNEEYRRACWTDVFRYKGIYVWSQSDERKVLCLPTKRHWRFKSQLHWVDMALAVVARDYWLYEITSLAIGAIGCGEGGLNWDEVYSLIKAHLDPIDLEVTVYLPTETKK